VSRLISLRLRESTGRLGYFVPMNPARKRTVRLVAALSIAVVLAGALMYTSFSAADPALSPSQLVAKGVPGRYYEVTGTVVAHSVKRDGEVLHFSVADRAGETSIPIAYSGEVPNPFREGREVIVTVEKQGGSYVAERNSLITKCPSKYKAAPPKDNPY
jgi:cytochrome c-type biogenesis protein CcmE